MQYKQPRPPSARRLSQGFLALLPRIRLHAEISFRDIRCPARSDDAIAEAVALAFKWFVRLARRGKDASQFASVLATYAVRAVRSGRRLCKQESAKDVLSPTAQQRHGFRVESLPISTRVAHEALYGQPQGQHHLDAYEERLRDNAVTPVPDQVAFRIDWPAWLGTLTARERRIIRAMAQNERTADLSRRFEVSPGRISQMRSEFHDGWQRFTGDEA